MGSRRGHRIAGAAVLIAALVLAFVVARGASFPVAGQPVVDWPAPPAVGSCQELDGSALATVPCTQPHGMEVTKAWQAIDTLPEDMVSACAAAADAYLGPVGNPTPIDGWRPDAPHYSAYQWSAPPRDVVGGRGWTVCLIAPWRPGEYSGSVHHLASLAERPAVYGMCGSTDGLTLLTCDQPHSWEQLGQATSDLPALGGQQGVAQAAAARQTSCLRLAASLMGVKDPTYGDRLEVSAIGQLGYSVTMAVPDTTATDGPGTTVTDQAVTSQTPTPGDHPGGTSPSAAPSTGVPTTAAPSTGAPSTALSTTGAPAVTTAGPTTAGPSGRGSGTVGSTFAFTPARPARPVAVLSCQAVDPHGQLVGSLMGWGDRPLPIK